MVRDLITANDAQLGPAMTALIPRHQAFVIAMFELGENATYTDAARRAGYEAKTENSLWVTAHRLAHSEKIQAAIREEAERMAGGLLPLAHKMMVDVIKNPAHRDHFKAVKHAQALAGISPTQKHEVVHKNDTASLRAQLAAAIDLFKSVAGPMIDVTPDVEITEDEGWVAT